MNSLDLSTDSIALNTQNLTQYLSDAQVLRAKVQGFHWNVIDPAFPMLHDLFESLYGDLSERVDAIAERLRALNVLAPADLSAYAERSTLSSASELTDRASMISQLVDDYETLIRNLRGYATASSEASDEGTADFYIEHIRDLEKTAWMLRSST